MRKWSESGQRNYGMLNSMIDNFLKGSWLQGDDDEFTPSFIEGNRTWTDRVAGVIPDNKTDAIKRLVNDFLNQINRMHYASKDENGAIEAMQLLTRNDYELAKGMFKTYLRMPGFLADAADEAEKKNVKLRQFDRAIDGVGTRVAVYGKNITTYTLDSAPEKLFMGKVVRLDDDMNNPVEFDDFIENSIGPVDKGGHGVYISENNMFVVEESGEETSPTFQPSGFGGSIKDIIAELLVTGLSKTDSNRVSAVIEDLKSKVGSDWEAQLKASGALPEEAMDIFISLLKDLEKQEQERIQFGAPRFEAPAIPKAKPRGRPKKEKVEPTEPMPSTPDIPAEINEDELSALLDDLINL
jgi:hypothetical protein